MFAVVCSANVDWECTTWVDAVASQRCACDSYIASCKDRTGNIVINSAAIAAFYSEWSSQHRPPNVLAYGDDLEQWGADTEQYEHDERTALERYANTLGVSLNVAPYDQQKWLYRSQMRYNIVEVPEL